MAVLERLVVAEASSGCIFVAQTFSVGRREMLDHCHHPFLQVIIVIIDRLLSEVWLKRIQWTCPQHLREERIVSEASFYIPDHPQGQ